MTDIRSNTIAGVKWSAIDKFSVQGVQFVISIILARLLQPDVFGVIAMLTIFIAISQTFVDSGFSNALIRKVDRTADDFSTVFIFNIVVGILCFVVFSLCAPFIAEFYGMPILTEVIPVLAITLILDSLRIVQISIFTINIDFRTISIINFSSALISGICGIILAYSGFGVWSLVMQTLIRSALASFLTFCMSKWKPLWKFSISSFKSLFSYGSKLLAAGLINTIYSNISPLLIGRFYTSKDLGLYDRGRQFGILPSNYIVQIFVRVTFPILSQIQDDQQLLIQTYRKYIKLTSLVMFFIMALIVALAKPIIMILLTPLWSDAIIYLQLFCLAEMFNHITNLNLNLLQVKGYSNYFLKLEIIKKSISFALLACAIPFGIIAICISQIIYSQIALYINTYYTQKLFGVGYFTQMKDFLKYLVAAFAACIPSFMMVSFDFPYLLTILLGFFSALLLYFMFFLKHDDVTQQMREEFSRVVKKYLAKGGCR